MNKASRQNRPADRSGRLLIRYPRNRPPRKQQQDFVAPRQVNNNDRLQLFRHPGKSQDKINKSRYFKV